jgi:hypothetical protein
MRNCPIDDMAMLSHPMTTPSVRTWIRNRITATIAYALRSVVLVPDDAVASEPNKIGRAMVWKHYIDRHPRVRCFTPGSMG